MHLLSKGSVIEHAFGLLGLRFPRLWKLKCKHQGKRVTTVVACCVLHNWCLMEDDGDISSFEAIDELKTEGHLGVPTISILGQCLALGDGTHKHDQLLHIVSNLP